MFHKFLAILAVFTVSAPQLSYAAEQKLTLEKEYQSVNPIADIRFIDNKTLMVKATHKNEEEVDYTIDMKSKKVSTNSTLQNLQKRNKHCFGINENEYNTLKQRQDILKLCITSDQKYALILSKKALSIHCINTKKVVIAKPINYKGKDIAISPDNKFLAISSSDNHIYLYNTPLARESILDQNKTYNNEPLDKSVQPKKETLKSQKSPSLWQRITNNKWKLFGATTCAIAGCLYKWRNHIRDYFTPKIILNFDVFIF
ncbi:MAG: hypothetical protein WD055_00315 [Candidatus Dependentiae bacterium]